MYVWYHMNRSGIDDYYKQGKDVKHVHIYYIYIVVKYGENIHAMLGKGSVMILYMMYTYI